MVNIRKDQICYILVVKSAQVLMSHNKMPSHSIFFTLWKISKEEKCRITKNCPTYHFP